MKNLIFCLFLLLPFSGFAQKFGLGVTTKGDIALTNSFQHKLRFESKIQYTQKEFNYDKYKILWLHLSCEYKWLHHRRISLASGVSIPVNVIYLEFPMRDGEMERDLEAIFFFDFLPLSIEYFPYANAAKFSMFGGTRFRYTYLNTMDGFVGIRQYF